MRTTPATAQCFAEALHTAAHAWKLALDRRLKPLGLSRATWMALSAAAKAPAPPTQIELADAVGIEGPSMVALIDRLEKAGLVRRIQDPADRRAKRIEVTEAGLVVFGQIRRVAAELRAVILADVAGEDIDRALALLEHIRTQAEAQD